MPSGCNSIIKTSSSGLEVPWSSQLIKVFIRAPVRLQGGGVEQGAGGTMVTDIVVQLGSSLSVTTTGKPPPEIG